MIKYIGVILGVMSVQLAFAQQDWEGDGELKSMEVVIDNERQISLPAASRNFSKVPPRPAENTRPPFTYDFKSFLFETPQISLSAKPLRLKAESKPSSFGGFVRAGYGNYASPMLEGYMNTTRDPNKLVGVHVYHLSSGKGPVDDKNSGSGSSGVSLYGRSLNEAIALSGKVSFDNRATHFYGYEPNTPVNKKDIRQSFNRFKIGGELANSKNSDFDYTLGADLSFLSDKYDAQELGVDLKVGTGYTINENTRATVKFDYAVMNRKDNAVKGSARNLLRLTPSVKFTALENLIFNVGFIAAFENDSIDEKKAHIYPDVSVTYPISPSVDFVGSLSGDMEKVSLQSLTNENLWLAPNVPLHHTNKTFDLQASIRARLGNKVGVNGGLSITNLKNWYNYVNTLGDQSKFEVQYDMGGVKRTNLFATLSYVQSERAKFMVRGDLFSYSADKLSNVYHRPTYKLLMNGSYNIFDKIILSAELLAQGGMKAKDLAQDRTITLRDAFDANVKVEYLFSKTFSAFLLFNNISSNKYPIYMHYPVRGFQCIGGITWSF
jgi:hypothetical protein